MIELYSYRTSNGRKVSIMLEECGLDYELRTVDITVGEQNEAWFLAINPNGRIPAIIDRNGPDGRPLTLFESGAILLYLATKTDRFLPVDTKGRWVSLQWLMLQMGGVGPMFGQAFHFRHQAPASARCEDIAYGKRHYDDEVCRLCEVLDSRLSGCAYLAGEDYSIADMAVFPWIALHGWLEFELPAMPNLERWYACIRERPAVQRGMDVPRVVQPNKARRLA